MEVSGKTKSTKLQITSGATNGYVLTSDASGNATWKVASSSFTGGTVAGKTRFTNGLSGTTAWFSGNSTTDLFRITQAGTGNAFVVEDTTNPDSSPFKIDGSGVVTIGPAGTTLTNNPLSVVGTVNSYVQINAQNLNNGNAASTDVIVTADNGNDSNFYGDFGINSSTYNQAGFNITSANDTYLYAAGGNLTLGTNTAAKSVIIFAEGTTTTNKVATFNGTGVGIGKAPGEKLDVSGKTKTIKLQVTSGATSGYILTSDASGNASWAANAGQANTASNVGGANGIFYQKSGVDLQFRSIAAGTNVTITSGATTLTINSIGTFDYGAAFAQSINNYFT